MREGGGASPEEGGIILRGEKEEGDSPEEASSGPEGEGGGKR